MYEKFFELIRRPFLNTPDVAGFFPAATHQAALTDLTSFLRDGEPVAVLLGDAGTGKTLICHRLLEQLDQDTSPVFIGNPHTQTVLALLQAILYDLSLPYTGEAEQELRLRLTDQLIERFRKGERTVLFVDEGHLLSADQIEELRLLTNLESRKERALQVLLVGQMGLEETLERPTLAGMRQRVASRCMLEPLSAEETLEYIRSLLHKAGGSADGIFSANAYSELCDLARGIPRRINQLCHRAMLLAYAQESGTIDASHITAAHRQLYPLFPPSEVVPSRPVAAVSQATVHDEEPTVVEVGAGCASPRDARSFFEGPTVIEPEAASSSGLPRSGGLSRFRQLYAG